MAGNLQSRGALDDAGSITVAGDIVKPIEAQFPFPRLFVRPMAGVAIRR